MTMKTYATILGALLLCGAAAQATLSSGTFSSSGGPVAIPDGNPVGSYSTINVSGMRPVFEGLSVYLNVGGNGYNGDLVCYLTHGGVTVTLVNRIGQTSENPFGSDASGFQYTLADSYGTAVHDATGTTGYYRPDGSAFNTSFGGNPNGDWTLTFADMAGGTPDNLSSLVGWSLSITAVPEPANVAMGIFAGIVGLTFVIRRRDSLRKLVARLNA